MADRLRKFRHHGITRLPDKGAWYYEIDELGMNSRLTDMQAALGRTQLDKLPRFIARRHELALRYDSLLADLPVETAPAAPEGSVHGHHLYPIRVGQRDEVFAYLREHGVGVQVHYVPIHQQPAYADVPGTDLPHTEHAYRRLLSLPLYPALTDDEQDIVVSTLADAVAAHALG